MSLIVNLHTVGDDFTDAADFFRFIFQLPGMGHWLNTKAEDIYTAKLNWLNPNGNTVKDSDEVIFLIVRMQELWSFICNSRPWGGRMFQ